MPTLHRIRSSSSPTLIPIGTLIKTSWRAFRDHWKETSRISIWLIVPALAVLLIGLANGIIPNAIDPLIGSLILIGSYCFEIWVTLRLMQTILEQEGEKSPLEINARGTAIGGYLWIELLHRIALIGAALPIALGGIGFPIFIMLSHPQEALVVVLFPLSLLILGIPAIWLATQLAFWPFILLTHAEGQEAAFTSVGTNKWHVPSLKKSIGILSESYHLVKGRFWATFIRLLLPGFIFLILFLVVTGLLDSLFGLVVTEEKMNAIFQTIPQGYAYFLVTLGQAVFLPLFITWQTKLFCSLKQNPVNT
jgi:hypothetical protein